jgi:hypothetical protein
MDSAELALYFGIETGMPSIIYGHDMLLVAYLFLRNRLKTEAKNSCLRLPPLGLRILFSTVGWAKRSVPIMFVPIQEIDGHGLSAFAHPTFNLQPSTFSLKNYI